TGYSHVHSLTINWRKIMTSRALAVLIAPLLLVTGCAATIHGTVQLVDSRQQPVPNESPKGAVVNMINTTAAVDKASSSATVDEKGEFESAKGSIEIEVKASIDGQPAPQSKVIVDREELGVTDSQGLFTQRLRKKAGTEVEVTVSKEAPGYRIEPWKTAFLVKLPKGDQIVTYR